ncbi:hypothetical protein BH23ACT10_BH23ACT10_30150 [soil metagenome]
MGLIGADTEDDLGKIERDAARLHAAGLLNAEGVSHRMAVVAGIRRVRDSGREDLAWQLLHAWLDRHDAQMP